MPELALTNLQRVRGLVSDSPIHSPVIKCLWEALGPSPTVLRHSLERTVLRVEHEDQLWVLKIYHPVRKNEWMRRLISAGPAIRELDAATALDMENVHAEQYRDNLGFFARHWVPPTSFEASAKDWGRELGRLHVAGWRDHDLSPQDFCWSIDGTATPLDFGSCKVTSQHTTRRIFQHLDLVRFLSAQSPKWRQHNAALFLEQHELEISKRQSDTRAPIFDWPQKLSYPRLIAQAKRKRRRSLYKRSARSLRDCSDFRKNANGAYRRGFTPPTGNLLVINKFEAGISIDCNGVWQLQLKNHDEASQAHRYLHLLEISNLISARCLGFMHNNIWLDGEPQSLISLSGLDPSLSTPFKQQFADEGWQLKDDSLCYKTEHGDLAVALPKLQALSI